MSSSFIRNDYTEMIPGRAYGYTKGSDGKYHTNPDSWAMIGPSGMYSTIEDMAKWTINFDQKQVGGQEVFNLNFKLFRILVSKMALLKPNKKYG